MKGRWPWLLAAQLPLTVVVFFGYVAVVGDEGTFPRIVGDSETWLMVLALFAGVSVVQLILLSPVLARRPRRERGVPVWMSLGLGAVMFALLAGALVMSIGHALFDDQGMSPTTFFAAVAVAGASWIGGTVYFAAFMRARPEATREGLVHLLSKRLLQATAFETLANIPLDVMIRKKSNCHCGDGSFFAFTVCMAVGLVVFGPAVLLSLLRKERALWYRERCDACATPRGEVMAESQYREQPIAVCSRCGHPATR